MAKAKTETKTKTKKKAAPAKTKKAPSKKAPAKKAATGKTKKPAKKAGKYFEGVGRRKTSIARVRIWADKGGKFSINEKDYLKYLPTEELGTVANAPLRKLKMLEEFSVTAVVSGGGPRGQAEAIRHGLARALVKHDSELRLRLKKSGFLKRDPRKKERKKYGLKKARKAPQWSKR